MADIEILRVKPGAEEKFEATQKKHWEWHKKQGDRWSWFVWTIESGDNMGAYVVASFAHAWNELDRENEILAPRPNPDADTEPFHQSVEEGYYVFRADLSLEADLKQPAPVASLTRVMVKPEGLHDFEAGLKQTSAIAKVLGDDPPTGSRWYELKNGGEWPQFLLIHDQVNWAGLKESRVFESMMKGSLGEGPLSEVLARFQKSIRSVRTEALRYHADLSKVGTVH